MVTERIADGVDKQDDRSRGPQGVGNREGQPVGQTLAGLGPVELIHPFGRQVVPITSLRDSSVLKEFSC